MIVRELLTRLGFVTDQSGARAYEASLNRIQRHAQRLQDNFSSIYYQIGALVTGGAISNLADEWTEAGNRIQASEMSSGIQARGLEDLVALANRAKSELTDVTVLYARILRSAPMLGVNEEQVARGTETIAKSFQLAGASVAEASGATIQLSQALQSGALQGEELRSVLEQAPALAQAIAKEFGVGVEELKALGKAGELESRRVYRGILNESANVDAQFARTTTTGRQAWIIFRNQARLYLGTSKQSQRVIKLWADTILWAADHMEVVAGVITALLIPAVMALVMWIYTTVAAFTALTVATLMWPGTYVILAVVAAVALLALALEDIYHWVMGNKSLIEQFLGPWEDFHGVRNLFIELLDDLGNFVSSAETDWKAFQDWINGGFKDSIAFQGLKFAFDAVVDVLELAWLGWLAFSKNQLALEAAIIWDPLKDAFSSALDWLRGKWTDFTGWLKGGLGGVGDWLSKGLSFMGKSTEVPPHTGPVAPTPPPGWLVPGSAPQAALSRPLAPTPASFGGAQASIGQVHLDTTINMPEGSSKEQADEMLRSVESRMESVLKRTFASALPSFPETA